MTTKDKLQERVHQFNKCELTDQPKDKDLLNDLLNDLWAEVLRFQDEHSLMLSTIKLCYRKHCLIDSTIGWVELNDILLNTLCNILGDQGYQNWLKDAHKAQEVLDDYE